MKAIRLLLLTLMLFVLLSACSTSTSTSTKPDDITQEFWDEAIQIILYIEKRTDEIADISWSLINGLEVDSDELSEDESELRRDLHNLALASEEYYVTRRGRKEDEPGIYEQDLKEEYDKKHSKLEILIGRSTLDSSELDESRMGDVIAKYKGVKSSERKAIKEAEDVIKKQEEEDLAWAESRNPTLGMTREQVQVSRWGKPQDINRTVNKYGTREQWVYPNYRYLYFEDGILTSFQD